RRFGHDPAFFPSFVDDGALDCFYGYGRGIDAENAGALAWGWANAPRELGEIVGLMQPFERFLPQPAVHKVIPFGDQVTNRTTRSHAIDLSASVTEMNATI